ncbi:GyrI-like domain-containing protein [Sungkyunkwania multivorans]|uniref:GyrI-like domain-containing protein n=1 Tax=Sungkyunkwania multivorans TaxID=1173618 RepID=A0ABW3CTT1_9FLAO
MKILKYLLLLIVVVVVGFLIYAATQPSEYEVSRTRTLEAPVEVVYNNVSDYKNWEAWGPWLEQDPSMTFSYGDQTKGTGASYSWSGKDGNGSMKMVEAKENAAIKNEMTFEGFGSSEGFWKFEPKDGGTEVTWGIKSENTPYIFKIFSAISGGYDAMMGPMFERGLEKLDSVTQIQAKEYAAMKAFKLGDISKKTQDAQKFIGIAHKTKIDHAEMTKAFEESLPKAGKYVAEAGLNYGDDYMPGAIFTSWNEETGESEFMIGVFLYKDLVPGKGMQKMDMPAGEVVTISKYGNYGNGDQEAHMAIEKYLKENNLVPTGVVYEMYVNDPASVKPIEIQTDVYYPLKAQ